MAALRCLDNHNSVQAVRFAADGGCFCLVGRTVLVRTAILQDPAFLHGITHDYWRGKALSSGDDVFVTRWLLNKGWKFRVQNAPEAEITTVVYPDSRFAKQLVRWQRNTVQALTTLLVYNPGFWALWR